MAVSTPNRRAFLRLAGAAGGILAAAHGRLTAAGSSELKALAIDGLAIFDARPIFALGEQLFPGRGAELGSAWRTRQFEYTWLRTLMGRYVDFRQITEEALVYAGNQLKLDLTAEKRQQLMRGFTTIRAWPDVLPALERLRAEGIRLALLSNFTQAMLDSASINSGLAHLLEPHLSTDRVKAYKPDPRAYQMAEAAFGLPREQIGFVAFGGWDAAGAKSFGYPTFWVNRSMQPAEELGVAADAAGTTLADLPRFVLSRRRDPSPRRLE